jgi:sigma-54 dependent transcriptional regulator, flagellar regulatory protein
MMHNDLTAWRAQYAPEIIGESAQVVDALETLKYVASSTCSILITGETGSGKELFARAAHRASARKGRPFVSVNCAAIPETLLESELFGHLKGSFTGAMNARPGRFMSANEGTIFLDEIGDLPLAAQAKLLRVLEERVVSPVGSDSDVPVDVRIIAATHRNLEEMVAEGKFRADLYFRLAVVPIHLPSLRERPEDILRIADQMLVRAAEKSGRNVEGFDNSARAALCSYAWPGNVRELGHLIERAVLLARRPRLAEADLQLPTSRSRLAQGSQVVKLSTVVAAAATSQPAITLPANAPANDMFDLRTALENLEREMIDRALAKANGNRTEAAALLGLNRTTLVEKLRKYAA